MHWITPMGKREAMVETDARRAMCLGWACHRGEEFCPYHHSTAYAELSAKHRADVTA